MEQKYVVVFECVAEFGKEYREEYDCNSYEYAKNWTGQCIRLEDVETVTYTKTGKRRTRPLKRGKYVSISRMKHWTWFRTRVYNKQFGVVVAEWEEREQH